MAGEDSLPFSRNWLTYNFSMGHLAGTSLSTLRDLFQSCLPQPISLGIFFAPDPNMTALIHAFQLTRGFSAFFPCPFLCAVLGPLPLPRRAGHCFRQSSPSSASHITGHNPTSQSLHHLLSHFKECPLRHMGITEGGEGVLF